MATVLEQVTSGEIRKQLEAALAEAYAPRPVQPGSKTLVCKLGRMERAHIKIAEREEEIRKSGDEQALAAIRQQGKEKREQFYQEYLDAVAQVNDLLDAYQASCREEGVEPSRLKVPSCRCGYCMGKRPIDNLWRAETLVRVALVNALTPTDSGVPQLTEADRERINKRLRQVAHFAKWFRPGARIDWPTILNGGDTPLLIDNEPTAWQQAQRG